MRGIHRLGRSEAPATQELITQVRGISRPLRRDADLDPLLQRIGDVRCVLLGEASHGTADFYLWRARVSRRLIEEKGFSFVAVEGDWPDCYRINRFIKDYADSGASATEVLHAFERWPTWMWANQEVADLAEWLREYNHGRAQETQVGFYGLDVYSLWDSLYQVMAYLQRTHPEALPEAQKAFRCFEPYGEDVQEYARATRLVPASCEAEVIQLLKAVRRQATSDRRDGRESQFVAEQNAIVVKNAEAYYRAMVRSGSESWNLRDLHMEDTLERLLHHHGPDARAIVWEHNTHIGDARFTDMADQGEVNVGQLVRERLGDQGVVLVGFSSHRGTVIAGREWEAPMERMRVPPAREDSWEAVLHEASPADQLLIFSDAQETRELLQWRGHRAIGVVYHPEYEYLGNYVPTVLPRRYDALMFIDQSKALRPLHVPVHDEGEVPVTYPVGV